jgi:hypothetical protein
MQEPCLCGCGRGPCDEAHFPKHTGLGRKRRKDDGLPKVPLYHACHMRLHSGDPEMTARVIAKAETYWRQSGQWELARPYFEAYMAKRAYLEAVR